MNILNSVLSVTYNQMSSPPK